MGLGCVGLGGSMGLGCVGLWAGWSMGLGCVGLGAVGCLDLWGWGIYGAGGSPSPISLCRQQEVQRSGAWRPRAGRGRSVGPPHKLERCPISWGAPPGRSHRPTFPPQSIAMGTAHTEGAL